MTWRNAAELRQNEEVDHTFLDWDDSSHKKRYDTLIRAFGLLASEFSVHELVIAGDGPQSAELKDLVTALNLDTRVHLLGSVKHNMALDLKAGANAFILYSLREPQGIVVLEAMAVGTPVVARAVGGVPELIDGTNGTLLPPGDQRPLAQQSREILKDDRTTTVLRRAGRLSAARFSWSALAGEYETAYRDDAP